ncbi:PAAR domain-containing protein [Streptomyces qinglanensis]|uniref:Zn-binding Pro-Ala-Ala-Arg (PAAR) domain-containing protein, incolved in TypeVI secretion n=1 Tax=Streptomyces qinglanensis TaxID=943816 RepID=A0A1H9WEB2_9ACTN|nr:PAAR domain-containing protein [Streptomyces qinglanensis]SES32276.1 Zn-binding Pro-Ala-Ala-Arg (PAAR) domain-containing protein, incolved in TypeVI secretion [Streptomyces qinglanensis]
MPPAARTGDPTAHGGVVAAPPPGSMPRVSTVLIGGRPAAVVGSVHTCVIVPHAALGPGNVILPNPATALTGQVLIGGLPAARMRDSTTCGATIAAGEPTVLIGGPL